MMAKEKKKVPNLRFKGFTDDWEQHKLKTVVSVNSGKDYKSLEKGNIPVYGTGGYITSVSKSLSNQDAVGLGRKGTINKPYILKAPFWTVDTLFYLTLKPENILTFIYSLIQKINWLKYDESTGLPSLSKKNIENVLVYLTKLDEQQKIGKLIVKLDKLITLQQRKLDLLKQLKKGFLQKMFADKDSKQPVLRFKGFHDDWERRKLGEAAEIIGGGTPSTQISNYWNGDINWYTPAEISNFIYTRKSKRKISMEGLENSSARLLPVGTVLFTSRAGIGKTAILSKEGTTNQGFQSIVPNKKLLDSYFIFSLTNELKKYGETHGAGSTFIEISGRELAKAPLKLPALKEQKKIGGLLHQVDELISLQHQKLAKYQSIKKSLLQQMFM